MVNPDTYMLESFGGQATFDDGASALRREGLGRLTLSNRAVHNREVTLARAIALKGLDL